MLPKIPLQREDADAARVLSQTLGWH